MRPSGFEWGGEGVWCACLGHEIHTTLTPNFPFLGNPHHANRRSSPRDHTQAEKYFPPLSSLLRFPPRSGRVFQKSQVKFLF